MNATITLKDYLAKGKVFVIPSYQRGYVWGKNRINEKDSVTNFIEDIKLHFENKTDLFLQGFTVTEKDTGIILIDGQQRTTCLYLLLKWLGYNDKFEIEYKIRKVSEDFLKSLTSNTDFSEQDEKFQDIFFFKKTLRILSKQLEGIDKEALLSFLLNKVKFLFITIDESQAIRVFTMMNGSKAIMSQEELIKAEMLRLVSLKGNEQKSAGEEWEDNLLRSRYAREWDRWLHWWRREDVQTLYGCTNTMGRLISSYHRVANKGKLTFESFRKEHLNTPLDAKRCFGDLRRLQKRFEDAFNTVNIHNMIGGILSIFNAENGQKFIEDYFVNDKRSYLKDYYNCAFLGMTHDQITTFLVGNTVEGSKLFLEKHSVTYEAIDDNQAYPDNNEYLFRLLLRLNINQDIAQGRPFNFEIWKGGNRSLEHIYPKSKVVHEENGIYYDGNGNQLALDNEQKRHSNDTDDTISYTPNDEMLRRENIETTLPDGEKYQTTEHSIGNLVLLYKNDNSSFNASNFFEKKVKFFKPSKEQFKSRHLLHTICVFAERDNWDGESIAKNKYETIKAFNDTYRELITKAQTNEEQD